MKKENLNFFNVVLNGKKAPIIISMFSLIIAVLSLYHNIYQAEKSRKLELYNEILNTYANITLDTFSSTRNGLKIINGTYDQGEFIVAPPPASFLEIIWKAELISDKLICPIKNINNYYDKKLHEIMGIVYKGKQDLVTLENLSKATATTGFNMLGFVSCMNSLYQNEIGIKSSFECTKEQKELLENPCGKNEIPNAYNLWQEMHQKVLKTITPQ